MTKLLSPSILMLGIVTSWPSLGQRESAKEFLPPGPAGPEGKLIWHDEFDGTTLDETKWNRLGDWKRRDGFWVTEDAYLNGKGSLVLRSEEHTSELQSLRHL